MGTSRRDDSLPLGSTSRNAQDHENAARRPRRRFRFKEEKKKETLKPRTEQSPVLGDGDDNVPLSFSRRREYRHHEQRHHHRSKRRRTSHPCLPVDPSVYDDAASQSQPEQAFRESLFDALGDDEGAAFWEGVYGQPIHLYSDVKGVDEGGRLERMSEEEYVSYVRGKMWKRSREGVEWEREERRRRQKQEERAKKQKDEKDGRKGASRSGKEGFVFEQDIEASLRRGEERRRRKQWRLLWEEYLHGWEDLQKLITSSATGKHGEEKNNNNNNIFLRNKIVWPVESKNRADVNNPDEIEKFFINATAATVQDGEDIEAKLMSALKVERVRWHPDKIQQRYGLLGIDDGTMEGVTAVFQVLDRMWNQRKR